MTTPFTESEIRAAEIEAARAEGRRQGMEEATRAVIDALHPRDTWQLSYLGGYTDAMRAALRAIEAKAKEG